MIRELEPSDYPALVRIYEDLMAGSLPATEAGLRHWLESEPPRARARTWVGEADGELAGCARAQFVWSVRAEGVAWVQAGVRPAARGRGLGSRLFAVAEEHVLAHGARKLETFALDGSPGERFVKARGFRPTRTELLLRLDLAQADISGLRELAAARRREGFRLVPLREVADRKRELHELYVAASADIPADDPEDDIPYDDWERQDLRNPELSWDGSFVVVNAEGRPVALAFLVVNPEAKVAGNEMTGTLPEYRRRGLARLAKLATIRWARENAIAELGTENDAENTGMRTLNESLGYRVLHVRSRLTREVQTIDRKAGQSSTKA